jgi:hypothetical protein
VLDAWASEIQYLQHLAPIWWDLSRRIRGDFWVAPELLEDAQRLGVDARPAKTPAGTGPVMVASYADLHSAVGRAIVLVEHGAGQQYGGEHPSYAGGPGRGRVVLFICPSERVVRANLERYPGSTAVAVGCPRLDRLHAVAPPPGEAIALAFHWNALVCPEASTALPHYRGALEELSTHVRVLGHGHPRLWADLEPWYRDAGIEAVRDVETLARRSLLLIADNTSLAWEWMTLDRPVVFLNAPWYRRGIEHDIRFWRLADAGVQVDEPEELPEAILRALADEPEQRRRRHEAVAELYAFTDGRAGERAARVIEEVIR